MVNEQMQPNDWVLDASVGIKLFIDGPLSDKAHNFFQTITSNPEATIFVPDLFYIECTNIIWKYVRFQGLNSDDAKEYIQDLGKLALQRVSNESLMIDALETALQHEISAYDASYVALAQRLNTSMVTADNKLVRKLNALDGTVIFLDEVA